MSEPVTKHARRANLLRREATNTAGSVPPEVEVDGRFDLRAADGSGSPMYARDQR